MDISLGDNKEDDGSPTFTVKVSKNKQISVSAVHSEAHETTVYSTFVAEKSCDLNL